MYTHLHRLQAKFVYMGFALAIPIKRSTYNLLSVLVEFKYLLVEQIDLVFCVFFLVGEEERRCENKVVKTRWGEGLCA